MAKAPNKTVAARIARDAPAPPAAKPAAPAPAKAAEKESGVDARVVDQYEEIPNGDGVMRAEPGDYVVFRDGATVVMPPSVFAQIYGND